MIWKEGSPITDIFPYSLIYTFYNIFGMTYFVRLKACICVLDNEFLEHDDSVFEVSPKCFPVLP
jgi:hypothetical protein